MKIRACLFDLDGTLLDTLPSIRHFLNASLTAAGIAPLTVEQTRRFVGDGARRLVERALLAGDAPLSLLPEVLPRYNATYDASFSYLTAPYPGIPEALAALSRAGLSVAVLSNKPDPTTRQLVQHFFADSVQVAYGAREGIALKPDPAAPLALCEELGVRPDEVAYFGDTAVDIHTGHAFGAALTVGVLWGFREREELCEAGADRLLISPSQIVPLILGDGL